MFGKRSGSDQRLQRNADYMSDAQKKQVAAHLAEKTKHDVIDQQKLEVLADRIWQSVPANMRPRYTAEHWREAIMMKCEPMIQQAELQLSTKTGDGQILNSKLRVLRASVNHQIVRAMQSVGERYR